MATYHDKHKRLITPTGIFIDQGYDSKSPSSWLGFSGRLWKITKQVIDHDIPIEEERTWLTNNLWHIGDNTEKLKPNCTIELVK